MKKTIYLFIAFSVLIFTASNLMAGSLLRASSSSDISEAYGKLIVKDFEKATGISVQMYVGPAKIAMKRLINGASELVATTIPPSMELKESGYVEVPFAKDSLALITNTMCTMAHRCNIDTMSLDQLRNVFSGKIHNWKELGGPDQRIIVIVPGPETGAYKHFQEQVMRMNEIKYDFITYSSTMVKEGVKNIPGAISFLSQGALPRDHSMKIIKINNLSPNDPNYPIFMKFSFVTKGVPRGPAKVAINFGLSKRGLEVMRARGLFPILN